MVKVTLFLQDRYTMIFIRVPEFLNHLYWLIHGVSSKGLTMLVQASSRYQKYSLFGNSRVIPINWGHADFREQPGVPRGVRAGCFYPYGVRKRNGPRESTQQVHWLQDGERLLAAAHWLEDVSILRKSGIYRKSDCQPLRFLFLHAVLHFLSFISYPFETKILSQT